MATWTANIKTTPTGSIYPVTVHADAFSTAREEIERLYDPIFMTNLRKVSSSSSGGDSDVDVNSIIWLIGLILALAFWPVTITIVGIWVIHKIVQFFQNHDS
jgi:hypothetical protein